MRDITSASLGYQVDPDHAGLVDEVIGWYDAAAADIEHTVVPRALDVDGGPGTSRGYVAEVGAATGCGCQHGLA